MKFALINGDKTEAQPGLKGSCIYCQSDTITKCGSIKIWHWAHKSKLACDPWWENETEWHRAWKNHFPTEWQENSHIDFSSGEKHIADIKTDKGAIIEFQHSAIDPAEAQSREAFYKNMVWVVDGTRLKRDYLNFCNGLSGLKRRAKDFFLTSFPEKCFPKCWLASSKPVFFDFQGHNPVDQQDEQRSLLWCLLPGRVKEHAVVATVSREQFIKLSLAASYLPPLDFKTLSDIAEYAQPQRGAEAKRGYPNTALRQYGRRHFRL